MNSTSIAAPGPSSNDLARRVQQNQAQRKDPAPSADATPALESEPQDLFKSTVGVEASKKIKVSFQPQDTGMLPVENVDVDANKLGDGLVGPRVRISEPGDFPTPHADENGNYIYTPDDPRFDATEAYVASTRALAMAEKYLGRKLPWGFADSLGRNQLIIHPHAGTNNPNAFYSSEAGSLNFFSFTDPTTGQILRTGNSGDIVSHETGHALLDAIRHTYISSMGVAAAGFHESFGDMTAMLNALQNDSVIDALQQQTQGDLSKPNLVADSAEMLGQALGRMDGDPEARSLRSAQNNFKYADQHFYPYIDRKNPNQGMGQEPHAYSNLFTGTFYDVFKGLYQEAAAQNPSNTFKDSIVSARDTAGKLLFRAMEFAPVGDPTYKDIALAFLKADDVDNGGKNRELLEQVFQHRQILTPQDVTTFDAQQKALPALSLEPKAFASDESAMKFLDAHRAELGVPKDVPLEFIESHTNKRGETFAEFAYNQDVDLVGSDFGTLEGSKVQANGGLLLAFDKDGKLMADNFDQVTRRDEEDIKDHLKVAIENHALGMAGGPLASKDQVVAADGTPYLQIVQTNVNGTSVIQRSPVIWG
jgi:hypothetical protein